MSTGSSKGLAAIRVPTPFRPKYLQLDRKVLCFQRGCRPQSAQICLSAANSGLAQPSAGPDELTERQMDGVTAGAGKVSMNDFHFVMRNNSSSPGLRDGGQVATTLTIVRGPGGFPVETVLLDGGLFEVQ